MPFTLPDKGEGFNNIQSVLFQEYIDVLVAGIDVTAAVLSGCAVAAQVTPNMTVVVAAGSVTSGGILRTVTTANGIITAAHATLPRLDLVVITSAGAIAVRAGIATLTPKPAVRVANDVVLAVVYVPATDTAIESNQIVDLRVIVSPAAALTSVQVTDLTGAGDSTQHFHASDRALANATGILALGNGSAIDRPYENYVATGGTQGWPDRTTSAGTLFRAGLGTEAVPNIAIAGNAPTGIFLQNYVIPNFTGDPNAYYVGGARFDTIVKGGIGGCTGVDCVVYKMPGAYTGGGNMHGGRFGVDARKATHYDGILTGLWAYTHGDRLATGGLAPSIEVNSFCNQIWSTTANYSSDPFITNSKRSVIGVLINNYQNAVSEFGGLAGDYQNTFGIALTSLGPGGVGGRAFGYQTGLYLTDCSKENIRIRGGVFGSTEKSDYGIKFEGNAMNIAGIALGPNKFNWGTGALAGAASNNGDMLYNEVQGILYFNQLGDVGQIMNSVEVVAGAVSNVVDRKIRVKIGGVNYYLLANTSWG